MNQADWPPELEHFRRATSEVVAPAGLHQRLMDGLARRELARLRTARRFVGFAVALAACFALTSLGLALWQDARFTNQLANSPDVWLDGEVRDP